jgi:hypothetical protein
VEKSIGPRKSDAFDFGSAAHALLLEGTDVYHYLTAIWRGGNKTKARNEWEMFKRANEGKLILTPEEDVAVFDMQAAVLNHEAAATLLYSPGAEMEVSWRTKPDTLPLPLQCRTDVFNPLGCALTDGRPYIVDFKTTASLNEGEFHNFSKAFVNFGYHRQAGFYTPLLRDFGLDVCDFFFVAVEVNEPFGIDVYHLTQSALLAGVAETVDDLQKLAECYATGCWPNRPGGVVEIDIPQWYLNNNPTPLLLP